MTLMNEGTELLPNLDYFQRGRQGPLPGAGITPAELSQDYVHGYSDSEAQRLADQANVLSELLHADLRYPPDSNVLEVACGVGSQTVTLASNSPEAFFTSIDVSEESLSIAAQQTDALGLPNVRFTRADVYNLPFPADHFDHIFVCFLLEHLADPLKALHALMRVLRPSRSIMVIEGDHGSAYFHPDSADARRAIQCLIEIQRRGGGDPMIGRRLHPLLERAGYRDIEVSPRMVYADATRPAVVDGFTRKTFIPMVNGVGREAIDRGLIDRTSWASGIDDLSRAAEDDGTFCYTFFKAVARR